MPTPSSATHTSHSPVPRSAHTRMVGGPSPANFTAFPTRFWNTRTSSSVSPLASGRGSARTDAPCSARVTARFSRAVESALARSAVPVGGVRDPAVDRARRSRMSTDMRSAAVMARLMYSRSSAPMVPDSVPMRRSR